MSAKKLEDAQKKFHLALIALLAAMGLDVEAPEAEDSEEEETEEPKAKSGKKKPAKEETEDEETEVDLDSLRAKAKKILKLEDGEETLTKALKKFGVDSLSDAEEDDYAAIDVRLQKLIDAAE